MTKSLCIRVTLLGLQELLEAPAVPEFLLKVFSFWIIKLFDGFSCAVNTLLFLFSCSRRSLLSVSRKPYFLENVLGIVSDFSFESTVNAPVFLL